jgi:hypothetical protein
MGGDKGKSIETIEKKEMKINVSDEGIPEGQKKKEKADELEVAETEQINLETLVNLELEEDIVKL